MGGKRPVTLRCWDVTHSTGATADSTVLHVGAAKRVDLNVLIKKSKLQLRVVTAFTGLIVVTTSQYM